MRKKVQSSIFYLSELLEQILHFLAIDKSLYPTLYVSRLWYRCGAPILWRCIKLKGNEVDDKFRLERFLKIVPGGSAGNGTGQCPWTGRPGLSRPWT